MEEVDISLRMSLASASWTRRREKVERRAYGELDKLVESVDVKEDGGGALSRECTSSVSPDGDPSSRRGAPESDSRSGAARTLRARSRCRRLRGGGGATVVAGRGQYRFSGGRE